MKYLIQWFQASVHRRGVVIDEGIAAAIKKQPLGAPLSAVGFKLGTEHHHLFGNAENVPTGLNRGALHPSQHPVV